MNLFGRIVSPLFSRAKFMTLRAVRALSQHRGVSLLAILLLLIAGVIAPLVGQQNARRTARENERDSATLIRKRAEWFYKQRAYPLGFIPAGARIKAFRQMQEMMRTQGTLTGGFAAQERNTGVSFGTIPPLSTTAWTSIGPQPTSSSFFGLTSGRVNAISVDPCDSTGKTVYVGGAQGGVWKTTDGGTNWTPLTDSQPSISTGSLAVDPNLSDCTGGAPSSGGHTGAIYFGTGEENFAFDSFYGAGVLTSHDGGTTWSQDMTFMPSTTPQSAAFAGPFIGSLAVDPATSGSNQVLLAGIQGVSATAHSGVYQSADGGHSWTMVLPSSTTSPACAAGFDFGTSVAFDPGDVSGNTEYAALGVPFPTGNGLEACNGLYKSTNRGANWTRVAALDSAVTGAGLSTANYGRMTIALANTTSSTANTTIVVAVADITGFSSDLLGSSTGNARIFISTNGGTSFAAVSTNSSGTGFCDHQCFYDIAVGIDPANPNFIFLGGGPNTSGPLNSLSGVSSVIFSGNGGSNFTDISLDNSSQFPIHVDTHAFAFAHPSGSTIVYVGNDGGVWSSANVESTPGTQSWTDLNNNLSLTQFYPGNSIHPSNPQVGFGGTQDNGTQKFDPAFNSGNPQETHDTAVCGDGGWSAIDPSTPSTVYAACEDIGNPGTVNKNQLDGEPGGTLNAGTLGQNWITLDTPAMDADNANFVPPLVLDSLTPANLYFGTCRVWQSMNGGLFWTDISGALDGSAPAGSPCPFPSSVSSGSILITTMAVAPTDSSTVYVGTDVGEIFVTTTASQGAAAKFGRIDNASTPGRTVTQIAVSPTTNTIAFVTFSGFSSCGTANGCDGKGHIFKFNSNPPPGSFTDITGNLPDVPVNDTVVDPNDNTNSTLYVATDVGVFLTTNGGTSWSPVDPATPTSAGLPNVECTSLKLNENARVLRVGTHGRGVWDLQLAFPSGTTSALTGISPSSATAGGGTFTLTLNGFGFTAASQASFNGTALTTTPSPTNPTTQLTAVVPNTAISGSGIAAVTVSGASGSLNFSIEGPLPSLSGVTPQTITSTASPVTITVNGGSFTANTGLAWTPSSGSLIGNTTLLSQNAGSLTGSGNSMSFTVTVPASLLQSTVAHMIPMAPRRPWPGPKYWLLLALFAAVVGFLLATFARKKRRWVLGTTLAAVVVLISVAGCGGGSNNPPPPGTVTVNVNAYTPGPGGGLSNTNTVTVQ